MQNLISPVYYQIWGKVSLARYQVTKQLRGLIKDPLPRLSYSVVNQISWELLNHVMITIEEEMKR
jgi:hypothetical protein